MLKEERTGEPAGGLFNSLEAYEPNAARLQAVGQEKKIIKLKVRDLL